MPSKKTILELMTALSFVLCAAITRASGCVDPYLQISCNYCGTVEVFAGLDGTAINCTYFGEGGDANAALIKNVYGFAFDSSDNMYISGGQDCSRLLRKVNRTDHIFTTLSVPSGSSSGTNDGIAWVAPYLYFTHSSTGGRTVYRSFGGTSTAETMSGLEAQVLAPDKSGGLLLGTMVGGGIKRYNPSNGTVITAVPGSDPLEVYGIAAASNGDIYYLASSVTLIGKWNSNTSTKEEIFTGGLGYGRPTNGANIAATKYWPAYAIALSPDERNLYLAMQDSTLTGNPTKGGIYRIDLQSGTIYEEIYSDFVPRFRGLAFDSSGKLYFASNVNGPYVYRIWAMECPVAPTATLTFTPSPTESFSPSPSPTLTMTATSSQTPTSIPTFTLTATPTFTPAYSPTASVPDPGDTPYVYPQPFRCGDHVAVKLKKPGRVKVCMLSSRGNEEARNEYSFGPGINGAKFNCSGMGKGMKFMLVEIEYNDGEKVRLKPVRIAVTQ